MSKKSRRRSRPRFEALEPRILYSADAASLLHPEALLHGAEVRSLAAVASPPVAAPSMEVAGSAPLALPVAEAANDATAGVRREIAFVDAAVDGYRTLAASIVSDATRAIDVVLIDSGRDGVTQITEALRGREGLSAIHIVSHGTSGGLQIGSATLDFKAALTNIRSIRGWGNALADDADLLLYGCDLAASADGRSLVYALSRMTGADVAASADKTGSALLGGNWELEQRIGTIETHLALSREAQDDWFGLLATYEVVSTADSGAGSLRDAIDQANASVGVADTINFNIPGAGVHTINVGSTLTITDAVTINATTDDSFATNSNRPAIVLDGNNAFTGDGLVLTGTADGSMIRGLVIRDFSGDGIVIQAGSNNNIITGNYIGRLTATGSDAGAAEANTGSGVYVLGSNNTIGGLAAADRNVISGNATAGLYFNSSAAGNVVRGNFIGTTAAGNVALGNGS